MAGGAGFHQRFTAVLSPDGRTFDGRWEISTDGVTWDVDSELSYPASDPTCPTWPVACPRAGR